MPDLLLRRVTFGGARRFDKHEGKTMRRKYTMTQKQYDDVLAACKPVPLIMLQCGMPRSPQENANAAWCRLGRELGFDGMSVEPTSSSTPLVITAEPVDAPL